MVELVAPDDGEYRVTEEGIALVMIDEPGFRHVEMARLQRQPQVRKHVPAQMGDAAATQLLARVDGLVDYDDAFCPGWIVFDQM